MSNISAQHLFDYRNNALEERTLIGVASDGTGTRSATNDVEYWDASGNLVEIFTPSAGAGVPRAANSRDYEYFVDGLASDQKAWTITSGTSKWGITAPTVAPSVAATSGVTATWSPLTEFTTMGILVDTNNNIEQLVSINANNNNVSTTLGTSGSGQPAWNQTLNGTTADGTLTWTNRGPVGLWKASSPFSNSDTGGTVAAPGIIFDPASNGLYRVISSGVNSGTSRPPFSATLGWTYTESTGLRWTYTGNNAPGPQWAPNTFYPHAGGAPDRAMVLEPVSITQAYNSFTNTFTQTVYGQWVTSPGAGGTSSASFASPAWQPYVSTTSPVYVWDNQLVWLNLGSANRPNNATVIAWAQGSTNFTAIKDVNGNIQVCITGGTTAGAPPVFSTTYGGVTNETSGPVQWACVGTSLSWATSTQWFLPLNGFVAPQSTSSYGGASIVDSNSNLETVINSGKSGAVQPVWNTPGNTTTDGTITWYDVETITPGSGNVTLVTKIGRRYYLIFLNSTKQNYSDLSPISAGTGPITNGQVVVYNLQVSSDTQVDSKVVVATADGGDPTTLYFVGQVSNATTSLNDNTPEETLLLNNIYQQVNAQGLDIGVVGNDPPPTNGSFPTVHKGRLWLAKNNFVYFSKSLDELTMSTGNIVGRYEEDWPPENAIDITPGAEFISGLLSDGYSLFIATERHVRKLSGSSPLEFGLPPVAFSEAGVLSQDVWKVVFLEGTPVGCMWLTPDFRAIGSDFNTYNDVGTSIQTTLNTINPAATSACWAESITYGPYNFYILAIPTGTNTVPDTWCVYDMHLRKWYIWTLAESTLTGLFYFSLAGVPRFLAVVPIPGVVNAVNTATGGSSSTINVANTITPTKQVWSVINSSVFGANIFNFSASTPGFSTFPNHGSIDSTGFVLGQGVFPANNAINTTNVASFTQPGVGCGTLCGVQTNGATPVLTQVAFTTNPGDVSVASTNPVVAGTALVAVIYGGYFSGVSTINGFTDTNGNTYQFIGGITAGYNGAYNAVSSIFICTNANLNVGGNSVTYTSSEVHSGNSRTQFEVFQVTNLSNPVIANTIRYIDPIQVQDITNNTGPVATPITSVIRTSWLHLGDPAMRKTLNEIEAVTSDTGMLITLEGASTAQDFQNPNVIFSNLPLSTNIFGQLKTFTSGYPSIYRFYRFTFTSTSSVSSLLTDVILGYFSTEVLPLNRI